MPVWPDLVDRLDAAVNRVWGENFRFVPWKDKSDFNNGVPDGARPVVDALGELTIGNEIIVPLGGEMGFSGIAGRMAVSDVWLSVPMKTLRLCNPREGDRVIALDVTPHHKAGIHFEIDRVSEDHGGHSVIHLLVMQEPH